MSALNRSSVTQLRDFIKCDQCRKEHKKCIPRDQRVTRRWDSQFQEKCVRCERLDYDCGPPTRKRPRSVAQGGGTRSESSRSVRRNPLSPIDQAENANEHTTHSPRPVESWTNSIQTPIVVKAAILISTYELLISCSLAIQQRVQQAGLQESTTDEISEKLRSLKVLTQTTLNRTFTLIRDEVRNRRGVERELLSWKLRYLGTRLDQLADVDTSSMNSFRPRERDLCFEVISRDSAEDIVLGCTANVLRLRPSRDSESPSRTPHSNRSDYIRLETQIQEILSIHEDVFPAGHIAYLNHDRETAFQLWMRAPQHLRDADILGRTFLHLLAVSHDMEMITRIVAMHGDAISSVGRDRLGMFPIDVAAGHHRDDVLSLLQYHRAQSHVNAAFYHSLPSAQRISQLSTARGYPIFGEVLLGTSYPLNTGQDALLDLSTMQTTGFVNLLPNMQVSTTGRADNLESSWGSYPGQEVPQGAYISQQPQVSLPLHQSGQPFDPMSNTTDASMDPSTIFDGTSPSFTIGFNSFDPNPYGGF